MKLKGTIKKILSQKNRYYFFSLYCDISSIPEEKINPCFPNSVSVSGKFAELEEEYVMEIEGEWIFKPSKDGRYHPWTFQANKYKVLESESPTIVMKKLQSLPGVGESIAYRIYEKFGLSSLTILEGEDYMKYTEIKGITPEKADIMHKAYVERKSLLYLKQILEPYGISETKINLIQRRWENPVLVIESNPYILANEDIISFQQADKMAMDFGFTAMSESRIESILIYALNKYAAGRGHTYLPIDELIQITIKMLNGKNAVMQGSFSDPYIRRKIGDFVNEGTLINDNGDIYNAFRYANECAVAENILRRTSKNNPFVEATDEQIESCLAKAEKTLGVTLADMQRQATLVAARSLTTIVTGGPGMGKTTCLKAVLLTLDYLAQELQIPELRKTLAAPSGMAAKRMKESTGQDASTIHRMLDYKPYANGEIQCKNENNPLDTDIIVLDESSMLDIDLMCLVSKAVKDDTMVIFVGDTDQLPSVGPGNVLHDLIDSGVVPVVRLNQTYRQGSDSAILANANKIREGTTNLILDKKDFVFVNIPDCEADEEGCQLTEVVQQIFFEEFIERNEDINAVQVLCPMRKTSETVKTKAVVNELNLLLQQTVNPSIDAEADMRYGNNKYRAGDKIMQLTNNYDKNVFNGDVGVIKRVSPRQHKLTVDFAGELVEYTKEELDQIQLSFATTIHKSQGSEYPCVIIPITNQHKAMLQRNLIYTAITRAKSRVYVVGDWKAFNYSILNVSNRHRNSKLIKRLKKEEI